MLDAPKPAVPAKKKRRGNPDKYRDYMKNYMQAWRARQRVKVPAKEVPDDKG
jgi:hypothetical protein